MSPRPVTVHRSPDVPVDAVAFAAGALLAPDDGGGGDVARAAPGARRLVRALAGAGVTVHAIAPRRHGQGPREGGDADTLRRRLATAGLGPEVISLVDADAAVPGTSRPRTLVVTDSATTAAGMAAAGHPVVVVDDEPVHHAVHRWLARATGPFAAASLLVAPPDAAAADAARTRHLRLAKPPGSLGRLEHLGARLAGLAAAVPPPLPRPVAAAVFAGDHGVHAQGVSPWPREVTRQMVGTFLSGGAAVNVLARQMAVEVVVVDVGLAGPVAPPADGAPSEGARLIDRNVRRGTADLATGAAMSVDEARRALDVGAEVAAVLVREGARCLVTGDMGIANTTPAAALVASLTDRPATAVTGPGSGGDDHVLTRKTALVAAATARARYQHGGDALAVLAEVGGLEHAALAGFVAGGAALQVPVVVDGVIAAAGLLVASRLVDGVEECVVAGHRSAEPGAAVVLDELGLDPVLDLDLRLGEGTGALLALPLVEAAARVLQEMATFDEAGIGEGG